MRGYVWVPPEREGAEDGREKKTGWGGSAAGIFGLDVRGRGRFLRCWTAGACGLPPTASVFFCAASNENLRNRILAYGGLAWADVKVPGAEE